jgi:hypothetical protein
METDEKRSFSGHNTKWLSKSKIAFHHELLRKLFDVGEFDGIYFKVLSPKFSKQGIFTE